MSKGFQVENVYSEEFWDKAPEGLRNHINKLIVLWKTIQQLPYERTEVRYSIIVVPFDKREDDLLDKKQTFIFNENNFREAGLRISGNCVFKREEPFGYLADIVRGKDLQGILNEFPPREIIIDSSGNKIIEDYLKKLQGYYKEGEK